MARYTGPVCKLCRREGIKLFLKGERCYVKCALDKRNYAPGQHGQRRSKITEYGIQLREKQKVRRIYGVLERQFRKYFELADRQKGITGENLLVILERRLDNMVFRMGFGSSRTEARQLVLHKHVKVNGRKVNIPSYLTKVGDVVAIDEKFQNVETVKNNLKNQSKRGFPSWLEISEEKNSGTIKQFPTREEIALPIKEQLIVELYSK
jgi:small subunit ribosomal protein S4